jgi:hypothetical protein
MASHGIGAGGRFADQCGALGELERHYKILTGTGAYPVCQ